MANKLEELQAQRKAIDAQIAKEQAKERRYFRDKDRFCCRIGDRAYWYVPYTGCLEKKVVSNELFFIGLNVISHKEYLTAIKCFMMEFWKEVSDEEFDFIA